MASPEEIENQQALLTTYRRNLALYIKQRAQIGSAYIPPAVANGIDEARNNIQHIKQILRSWGIEVLNHPDDEELEEPSIRANFQIISPEDGDLLPKSSHILGFGPPNKKVFTYYRLKGETRFYSTMSQTNDIGFWSCNFRELLFHPGVYEIYVAGILDEGRSEGITIYHQNSDPVSKLLKQSNSNQTIIITYSVHRSYIEGTQLRKARLISSGKKEGSVTEIRNIVTMAGRDISDILARLVSSPNLTVHIEIDKNGKVKVEPTSTKLLYYVFPVPRGRRAYGPIPSTDLQSLRDLVNTQLSWEVSSVGGRIPQNILASPIKATSEYLEIRHEGYKPEFLSFIDTRQGDFSVQMTPVLNKRIAILEFPNIDPDNCVSAFSQIIANEMVNEIESHSQLATYGYLAEDLADQHFRRGNASIELGNEVLMLSDVKDVERKLEQINIAMVSGEGRHLRRRELDIHYIVSGYYQIL